jgi:large subunit ribosomal protein L29
MAETKAHDLAQLTVEELLAQYRKFKDELFHLRFQLATQQLEKTHRLRSLRKDLARVLTFLAMKQAQPAGGGTRSEGAAAPGKTRQG